MYIYSIIQCTLVVSIVNNHYNDVRSCDWQKETQSNQKKTSIFAFIYLRQYFPGRLFEFTLFFKCHLFSAVQVYLGLPWRFYSFSVNYSKEDEKVIKLVHLVVSIGASYYRLKIESFNSGIFIFYIALLVRKTNWNRLK